MSGAPPGAVGTFVGFVGTPRYIFLAFFYASHKNRMGGNQQNLQKVLRNGAKPNFATAAGAMSREKAWLFPVCLKNEAALFRCPPSPPLPASAGSVEESVSTPDAVTAAVGGYTLDPSALA